MPNSTSQHFPLLIDFPFHKLQSSVSARICGYKFYSPEGYQTLMIGATYLYICVVKICSNIGYGPAKVPHRKQEMANTSFNIKSRTKCEHRTRWKGPRFYSYNNRNIVFKYRASNWMRKQSHNIDCTWISIRDAEIESSRRILTENSSWWSAAIKAPLPVSLLRQTNRWIFQNRLNVNRCKINHLCRV